MNLTNNKIITVALSILIVLFLYYFFNNDWFFQWAFERHQNRISWFIRPLFLIPFCYFAYKKSLNGILLSILALFTSMFWFPIPEIIDPKTIEFLNMEKLYLANALSISNLIWYAWIILFFYLLARACWYKSIKTALFIVLITWVIKIVWSVFNSPESGKAIIPFFIIGFIILLLSILIYKYILESKKN
jgi:hypothetical protein